MRLSLKKICISIITLFLFAGVISAEAAEVISVKGKVEVSRNDQWITLNVGDQITESETISTGFQSEVKIKYKDSILQLGALSRITLSKLATSTTKDVVDIYLNTGAVRSKVNHTATKKVSYTVNSSVATASVRGTDFLTLGDGSITCFSGAVVLTPAPLYDSSARTTENIEEMADPADGESDASTPATDVDPNAGKGSVMVLGGQSSTISANGTAATPFETAVKSATKTANTVKTQAAAESIKIGQTDITVTETSIEETTIPEKEPEDYPPEIDPDPQDPVPEPDSGSIRIEITWD